MEGSTGIRISTSIKPQLYSSPVWSICYRKAGLSCCSNTNTVPMALVNRKSTKEQKCSWEKDCSGSPPFSPSKRRSPWEICMIWAIQDRYLVIWALLLTSDFLSLCKAFPFFFIGPCCQMQSQPNAQAPAVEPHMWLHCLGFPGHGLSNQSLPSHSPIPSQLPVHELPHRPSGYLPSTLHKSIIRSDQQARLRCMVNAWSLGSSHSTVPDPGTAQDQEFCKGYSGTVLVHF